MISFLFFLYNSVTTLSDIPITCNRMQKKKIVPSKISKRDLGAFVLIYVCFHRKVDQTYQEKEKEREKKRENINSVVYLALFLLLFFIDHISSLCFYITCLKDFTNNIVIL
jgi:hypothetical protein